MTVIASTLPKPLQTITLTGGVTGSGTGSFAATVVTNANLTGPVTSVGNATSITALAITSGMIANDAVTFAKMQNVATGTVFYRKTAATGNPETQTLAALKTDLDLTGTNSGDQTIILTGDVTGSGTGSFATTIANDSVTYAKIQNVTATDKLLGRVTAGAGDIEEITCTAFGRSLIDDVDASTARSTLGLGSLATQSGTFSGTSSGTNTGDNAVNSLYSGLVSNATHTGDATGATALTVVAINGTSLAGLATGILKNTTATGVPSIAIADDFPTLNQNTTGNAATVTTNANLTGPVTSVGNATAITANAITDVMLADMATATFKGRTTAGTGNPENLTVAQAKTLLNLTGTNSGDQTITLTGGVTGSGTGSFTATVVTNANLTGPITSVGNATSVTALAITNAMLAGSIAASKLIGTDISTVGTITAGTWTGTDIAIADGGTGSSTAAGARTNLGLGTIATEAEANYALLAGRAGNQILNGGTAASGTLTLKSTAHATKGKILWGTASVFDDLNDRVGIGITAPLAQLHLSTSSGGTFKILNNGTHTAAVTGATAYRNEVEFDATSATTLANIYGDVSLTALKSSINNPNITNYYAYASRVEIDTAYTGTVAGAYSYGVLQPVVYSPANRITAWNGFYCPAVTSGANTNSGNTSGTVTNVSFRALGHSAAAGVGGTLNNYGVYITTPNGSGASGTTNNYGLRIAHPGTFVGTTNYTIYADSTADSYFAGDIGIGTLTPGSSLHVSTKTTTGVGAQVDGVASQTGDLTQWRDSTGTILTTVNSAGKIGIGTATPGGQLHLDSTNTSSYKFNNIGTLTGVSSGLVGSRTNFTIDIQSASTVSALYGSQSIVGVTSSLNNPAITGLYANYSRCDIDTAYTNTVTNTYAYFAATPTIDTPANKITNNYGFYAQAIAAGATNNSGNTSGTITNASFIVFAHTAAAGVGGTLNNYGLFVTTPNGSGASGTTNNYGLRIINPSGAFVGTTNYTIYADSTADTYFAGDIGLGTAAPLATLHVSTKTAAGIGLLVRGVASQTGDLTQWQNSSGTVLSCIDSAGKFGAFAGFADAVNVLVGTTTGTKIGTGITQKLGFYNATPIAQRAGAAQASVATTAATNVTPYGYTTAAQANAIITLLNELRDWAVAQGFIKGAA